MKVTIIDYGMGNLFSVQRAVEVCGVTNITLGTTPDDIIGADCLILPGVGAFKESCGFSGADKGLFRLRETLIGHLPGGADACNYW